MVGNANKPMVTTVAPTMPVLAASNIPTNVTAMPMPAFRLPITTAIASNKFSATFDFSSITPIKTKSGTAIKVVLVTIPNKRLGKALRYAASNIPKKAPTPAKINAVPASENATGNPISRTKHTHIKRTIAIYSITRLLYLKAHLNFYILH